MVEAKNRKERSDIKRVLTRTITVTLAEKDYHKLLLIPGVELIAVIERGSILLYFLCASLGALQKLREVYDSGRLKNSIEELFNSLLKDERPVRLSHLSLSDYCESENCFSNGKIYKTLN